MDPKAFELEGPVPAFYAREFFLFRPKIKTHQLSEFMKRRLWKVTILKLKEIVQKGKEIEERLKDSQCDRVQIENDCNNYIEAALRLSRLKPQEYLLMEEKFNKTKYIEIINCFVQIYLISDKIANWYLQMGFDNPGRRRIIYLINKIYNEACFTLAALLKTLTPKDINTKTLLPSIFDSFNLSEQPLAKDIYFPTFLLSFNALKYFYLEIDSKISPKDKEKRLSSLKKNLQLLIDQRGDKIVRKKTIQKLLFGVNGLELPVDRFKENTTGTYFYILFNRYFKTPEEILYWMRRFLTISNLSYLELKLRAIAFDEKSESVLDLIEAHYVKRSKGFIKQDYEKEPFYVLENGYDITNSERELGPLNHSDIKKVQIFALAYLGGLSGKIKLRKELLTQRELFTLAVCGYHFFEGLWPCDYERLEKLKRIYSETRRKNILLRQQEEKVDPTLIEEEKLRLLTEQGIENCSKIESNLPKPVELVLDITDELESQKVDPSENMSNSASEAIEIQKGKETPKKRGRPKKVLPEVETQTQPEKSTEEKVPKKRGRPPKASNLQNNS